MPRWSQFALYTSHCPFWGSKSHRIILKLSDASNILEYPSLGDSKTTTQGGSRTINFALKLLVKERLMRNSYQRLHGNERSVSIHWTSTSPNYQYHGCAQMGGE